jgi:hypothetical protein
MPSSARIIETKFSCSSKFNVIFRN